MAQKRRLFEIEGLKFEIGRLKIDVTGEEGEQQLKMALADEFTRVIAPVTQLLHPQLDSAAPAEPAVAVVPAANEKRSPRRAPRSRATGNGPSSATAVAALDWKPNIEKYGNPTADWSTGMKAMWLLYCYSKDNGGTSSEPKGLSIPALAATYNKHFPHTKTIQSHKVYRDFNSYAGADRPKVTADRSKEPPVWYLAGAGTAAVEELIKKGAPLLLNGVA